MESKNILFTLQVATLWTDEIPYQNSSAVGILDSPNDTQQISGIFTINVNLFINELILPKLASIIQPQCAHVELIFAGRDLGYTAG